MNRTQSLITSTGLAIVLAALVGCKGNPADETSQGSTDDSSFSSSVRPSANPRTLLKEIVDDCIERAQDAIKLSRFWEDDFENPRYSDHPTGADVSVREIFEDGSGESVTSIGIYVHDFSYDSSEQLAMISLDFRKNTFIKSRGVFAPGRATNIGINLRYNISLIYDNSGFVLEKVTRQRERDDESWSDASIVQLSREPALQTLLAGHVRF